ncbi:MAG: TIGR03790 family protein [Desulfobacteraceae bacterium]
MLLFLVVFSFPLVSPALEPSEVLVVANRNAWASIGIAKHYMEKRGIPEDQLLKIWVTDKESCTREAYEKKVLTPVRRYLGENPGKIIRCIVTVKGVPLRVSPPAMSRKEEGAYEALKREGTEKRERLKGLEKESEEAKALRKELGEIREEMDRLARTDERSALDSELALALAGDYDLSMWIPNPFFLGYRGRTSRNMPERDKVLMVSRLDGPGEEVVKRIIDDSVEVEKEGLMGTAYFDARWPRPSEDKMPEKVGYGFYDLSIHEAAERVRKSGRMPVVVDSESGLFQPGDCPDAALYCGWYRLARYVDAFEWRPGAVGYHIASQECQTLREGNSRVWCKRMLEEGAAAVVGPVGEPYVQAFPLPEMFFGLLVEGRWTLAECYALSVPFWSWQMVLVGDPLYRPFTAFASGDR